MPSNIFIYTHDHTSRLYFNNLCFILYQLAICYQSYNLFSINIFSNIISQEGRRKWQPTPVFMPGKSHGQRSLVGYSPWGRKESDTIERLHFHFHGFVHNDELFKTRVILPVKEKIICDPGKRATRISDLAYMSFSL